MEKVEIVVYKEIERVHLAKDEAKKYIAKKEKSENIKCVIVDINDEDIEEKATLSCSGSGRIGKTVGLKKGIKDFFK